MRKLYCDICGVEIIDLPSHDAAAESEAAAITEPICLDVEVSCEIFTEQDICVPCAGEIIKTALTDSALINRLIDRIMHPDIPPSL